MSMPTETPEDGRPCQFSKTKMCKFFLLRKCTKGNQCTFAHTKLDLRVQPDLRCTKLCKALIQTGQCKDKNCSFAHSRDELRSTGIWHKTKFCRFMQAGHCSLGSKCNFAHTQDELREPDKQELLEAPPGLGWDDFFGSKDDEDGKETEAGSGESTDGRDTTENRSGSSNHSDSLEPAYVQVSSMPASLKPMATMKKPGLVGLDVAPPPLVPRGFPDRRNRKAALDSYWSFPDQMGVNSPADILMDHFNGYPLEGAYDPAFGAPLDDWNDHALAASMQHDYSYSGFGAFAADWGWQVYGDRVLDRKMVEKQAID